MRVPLQTWRERARDWALRRQGPDALPLRLVPRRIYILPTAAGFTYALLVLAMFVAGMNYGNGLVLLLTFWMTGFALVAMIQTQRGMASVRILQVTAQPAFAGDSVQLDVEVEGPLATPDLIIGGAGGTVLPASSLSSGGISLGLRFQVWRRGRWQAPVLSLESRAPFGLFRAWTWLRLDATTLVYPKPQGDAPRPESDDPLGTHHRQAGSLDELAGLRAFREGDSPRQVAWKAYARGAPLLVREYLGQSSSSSIFDYATVPLRGAEARLSQLTRWVLDASSGNLSWTLRLPGASEMAGSGAAHRQQCLEALALFAEPPDEA
jgi:uncharacterized protein (DUF58 family)